MPQNPILIIEAPRLGSTLHENSMSEPRSTPRKEVQNRFCETLEGSSMLLPQRCYLLALFIYLEVHRVPLKGSLGIL